MNISKINRDERQELLRMLGNLNSYGNRRSYKERSLPRELKKWQKRISAWHTREREIGSRFTRQWDKKVASIRQEIYFGTAQRALALMKALKAK